MFQALHGRTQINEIVCFQIKTTAYICILYHRKGVIESWHRLSIEDFLEFYSEYISFSKLKLLICHERTIAKS